MTVRRQTIKTNSFSVRVLWRHKKVNGQIDIFNGKLTRLQGASGRSRISANRFKIASRAGAVLIVKLAGTILAAGAGATRIKVSAGKNSFTFFARDVNPDYPVYIPEYGVIITLSVDRRSYGEMESTIQAKGLRSELQKIEKEPEETYEQACRANREEICAVWLGLSRDMRIFRIGYPPEQGYWGQVEPYYHFIPQTMPGTDKPIRIAFCVGPGASCRIDIKRRLEDGCLPIITSEQREKEMVYRLTAFATLETRLLTATNLRGSDWQAVYANSCGNMLTPSELEGLRSLLKMEMRAREEETICCIRVEACNTGKMPRYAWFRGAHVDQGLGMETESEIKNGFSFLKSGCVFGVNRLDGKSMPEEEVAILLPPGGKAVLEMMIPHRPLAPERAEKLMRLDLDQHLDACRKFWRAKLESAAQISVPEPAVNERIRAGLLHCDLITLGREPKGTLMANVGIYSPIGSESAPIIQFFDSIGWHSLAERCLSFFFDRQRPDGFIQSFGNYQLETGPVLWTLGEHYRCTDDLALIRRLKPKILKACEYLLQWRGRNKKEELRGRGWGLMDGKVADSNDFFHSFMLNGLSCLGIQRAAEMLARVDPASSRWLAREAEAFRRDIRTAFYQALANSPVVPCGDGTWVSPAPPWAEHPGPVSLYAEKGQWWMHGAFGTRDSIIGALYLFISEVLTPAETGTTFLLKSHQELFTRENAAMGQPYYSRHDYLNLKRGNVRAFLKTYYNQFSSLQDRQTYTFWEHYLHCSPHKTHEEGWFLMQTRWMLFMEEDKTLMLLPAIPRRWMADGRKIILKDVATRFGPASLETESCLDRNVIRAKIVCRSGRKPRKVVIRLPHPAGKKASAVKGGKYDPSAESVTISPFKGAAKIELRF